MSYFGDNFIWFVGRVEDRDDPLHRGRVRVRCFGLHTENQSLIPSSSLPWAQVMMPSNSSSTHGVGISPTGLQVGSHVVGFFTDGKSMQQPMIMGTFYGDSDLQMSTSADTQNSHPSHVKKVENVPKDIPIANTSDKETESLHVEYDFPAVHRDSETDYPLNKVLETEGGHVFEVDDTSWNKRISQYHNSGTTYEIQHDGTKTETVVKDNYTVIFGDDYIYVKGNAKVTVDGNVNQYVKGDYELEVDGNYNVVVDKNHSLTVAENSTHTVGETHTETVKNQTVSITETKTEKAETSAQTYEKGEITVAGITQTQHVHPQNSGNHFGGGTDTSKPKG